MCFYKHLVPQPYRVFIEIYKSGVEIMKGTIYKIKSKVNGKVYIGMTTRNIEIRWYEHKTELIRNKHHNIKLQRHYNKYGDVFNYSIIEELEFEDEGILEIELDYIKKFNSVKNGFNISEGGKGCLGYIGKNRKISNQEAQYIKNISFFKIYEYSKLAKKFNCSNRNIINIVEDKNYKDIKINFNDYDEYKWYEEEAKYYRFKEYGDKINKLYNYYINNKNNYEVPRKIRKIIRPESIKNSLLKDDYEYKDKCSYILNRVKRDRQRKELMKQKECEEVLLALLEYNNYEKASLVTDVNIDKVRNIKNGQIYGNYCKKLRERCQKLKLFKDIPPDKKEFEEYILNHTYTEAIEKYGVSRPTIKRWIEFFDIYKPLEYVDKNKDNPNSKITKLQVLEIREKYDKNKKTPKELSIEYNLSTSQIYRIIKRQAYKN